MINDFEERQRGVAENGGLQFSGQKHARKKRKTAERANKKTDQETETMMCLKVLKRDDLFTFTHTAA